MLEKKLEPYFNLTHVETYEEANTLSRLVADKSNEAILKNELYHAIYFSLVRNNCYEIDKISLMQVSNTMHATVIIKVYDKEGNGFLLNTSNWLSKYKLGLTDIKDLEEAEKVCGRIVERLGKSIKNLVLSIDSRLGRLDNKIETIVI